MTATLALDEVFSHALRGEICHLSIPGGLRIQLPVDDWTRSTDAADELLLRLCDGPTLDVGCGPGRFTAELAARGHIALGIDIVNEAVKQSQQRGAAALRRNVFTHVPGEGRWETALLADGNIGIGGDPVALLHRIRRILAPGGQIVVEAAAPQHSTATLAARLECACGQTEAFPWAIVNINDLPMLARHAGLIQTHRSSTHGRWVCVLREAA